MDIIYHISVMVLLRSDYINFTEEEKREIVHECTEKLISPSFLATKYNVNVTAIRDWVKSSGKKLPWPLLVSQPPLLPPAIAPEAQREIASRRSRTKQTNK